MHLDVPENGITSEHDQRNIAQTFQNSLGQSLKIISIALRESGVSAQAKLRAKISVPPGRWPFCRWVTRFGLMSYCQMLVTEGIRRQRLELAM